MVLLTLLQQNLALRLLKLETNPGILPVKQGQAHKQVDKWIIVKRLDLTRIGNDLDINTVKLREFLDLVDSHKPFANESLGIRNQVEYMNNITITKFNQLIPTRRFKRALFNPLGSFIKEITGNLDHDDAIHYDLEISKIGSREIALEKKMILVTKMLDNFVNSTDTLNSNTLLMNDRLNKVEQTIKAGINTENNCLYRTYTLNIFNTFLSTFRNTYTILNEIETALAFTKVSVLHQSIVNSTELLYLLKTIEQSSNLMYEVKEDNLLKFERIITVKSYVKESQITFILEVPLIDKIKYNYFKIYAVPMFKSSINKTMIVIPEFPYLLAKDSVYQPVSTACDKIDADKFLCNAENMVQYAASTCVEQLLEFHSNPTNCVPHAVDVEDVKVQRLSKQSWIVFSRKPSILFERCSHDDTKELIQGTYVITIRERCTLHLNELKLSYQTTFAETLQPEVTPIVSLPELRFTNSTFSTSLIDIKNINLEETRHFARLLKIKQSEVISENQGQFSENPSAINVKSVSLGTILLYVILPISLLSYVLYRYKFKFLQNHRNPTQTFTEPDNFALGEGGVMRPPGRIVVVNASETANAASGLLPA